MSPLKIRKGCLQFRIVIYITQVIVDSGADIKINHTFRPGHLDAFILVDVTAYRIRFSFFLRKARRQPKQTEDKAKNTMPQ